jgi:TolA-binding protein
MAMLEGRVARTERNAAASQQTPGTKKMQTLARQHMEEERRNFKADDIQKAEELYTRASQIMRDGGDAKKLLESVVSLYPQLNRAGCAQLYRAQQETSREKVLLLKDCIARFSTCYYGDGAQVGPLAMFELAEYYQMAGKERDARELFSKIRKEYSESVGHDGVLLIDKI